MERLSDLIAESAVYERFPGMFIEGELREARKREEIAYYPRGRTIYYTEADLVAYVKAKRVQPCRNEPLDPTRSVPTDSTSTADTRSERSGARIVSIATGTTTP